MAKCKIIDCVLGAGHTCRHRTSWQQAQYLRRNGLKPRPRWKHALAESAARRRAARQKGVRA